MKKIKTVSLVMASVIALTITGVSSNQTQLTAETTQTTAVNSVAIERNPNNVLQMPSDGLALNVLGSYVERDSSNNITALNFPKTATGEIDEQVLIENTENYLANYLTDTQVGRVFFNVNYTRSNVPSDVFDTMAYNVGIQEDGTVAEGTEKNYIQRANNFADVQYYWYTLNEGIDIIGYGIDYVNEQGVEAWASVRMNDHHFPNDTSVNASFRFNYASTWGVNGSSAYMDYTVEAVQTCYLNYIKEIFTNYDLIGIDLDFLRTAPYMSQVSEENILKLNDFVQKVKTEITAIRPDAKVGVRVYATEEINLGYGLDVAQWVADGSVDVVAVANFYQPTSFDLPLQEWRASIDGKNTQKHDYALLAGLDWAVKSNPNYWVRMTPAHTRGFTSSAYANGADGVYLFNMFYIDGAYATEYIVNADGSYATKNIFRERMLASDSLESAESGLRRYTYGYFSTYIEQFATLPRALNGYNSTSFKVQTGTAPENGYYMIALGLDHTCEGYEEDSFTVLINGKPMQQIGDMPRSDSLPYRDATSEIGVNHLTQVAKRFVQFKVSDLSVIKDGHNEITVINRSGKTQKIVWVEVFVDGTTGATPSVAN